MRLLLIRHAPAEDREAFARTGREDAERPLSDVGRRKMRRAARGLCRVVPAIDRLVTSPLIRAAQTAEIVAERYAGLEPVEVADWGPAGSPQTVTRWLQAQPANLLIAAVGHEPNLSLCVGWLMARASTPFFAFKKGAACLLEFEGDVDAGAGTLLWALRPSHLRRLGA